MLAQTYLPARKLGLKAAERDALIDMLEKLERGVFIHEWPGREIESGYAVGLAFNMGDWDCGTTACIAGWCDLLHGTHFVSRMDGDADRPGRRRNLQDLFFVNENGGWLGDTEEVTPKEAAQALRHYLQLGKPYWLDVLEPELCHGREVHPEGGQEDGAEGHQGRVASPVGGAGERDHPVVQALCGCGAG